MNTISLGFNMTHQRMEARSTGRSILNAGILNNTNSRIAESLCEHNLTHLQAKQPVAVKTRTIKLE